MPHPLAVADPVPAFWLLVPGALGLIGVTEIVGDPATATVEDLVKADRGDRLDRARDPQRRPAVPGDVPASAASAPQTHRKMTDLTVDEVVLDPLQFESARKYHGALKVRLRGVYIGVVGSV